MKRKKPYSRLYNVQRILLLIFYVTTMTLLFIPAGKLLGRLFPDALYPLVVVLILYLVFAVVLGTFIYLLSHIPFNLATAFDPIKNEIASGELRELEPFGKRITRFVTEFFNFSFLDIEMAVFQAEQGEPVSHLEIGELKSLAVKLDLRKASREQETIRYMGVSTLETLSFHVYVLPVWFGDRWLGYLGLLSPNRISSFFQQFLEEFENNFLDDQFMHIIHLSNSGKPAGS